MTIRRRRGPRATVAPEIELSLEAVITGVGFADLPASALQLAIARAAEGRPLDGVLTPDELEAHFGVAVVPECWPTIVCLIAGVRGGKSFLAACAMIWAALRADLSLLKVWELPRAAIIGPTTDAARATFLILRGIIEASPILVAMLDGEPNADALVLLRPDGRRVEVTVVAASRGGATVRNRWLVGAVIEEVAQIGQEIEGAKVSVEEIARAIEPRLLCTDRWQSQLWEITSPYGPQGRAHKAFIDHFGKPGRTLVVHAPTRALNPTFPQATIDAIRATSPDVAAREYDASWVDADEAFLPASLIDPATRKEPLVRRRPHDFVCASGLDAGLRGNATTLVIAWGREGRDGELHVTVGGVWQWRGSQAQPLVPSDLLREIRTITMEYGSGACVLACDGWSFDALRDIARQHRLDLVAYPGAENTARYSRVKTLLGNGLLELPPSPQLRADLIGLRRRATAGGIAIHLPRTADGRHCDFAPALALAVDRVVKSFEYTWATRRISYANLPDMT